MADADLLIQVVDASDADRDQHIGAVDGLLKELGLAEKPRLLVWNKADLSGLAPGVERDEYGRIRRVFLSARTGAGLAALRGAIAEAARTRQTRTPSPELISL